MSGQEKNYLQEIEGQMRAAQALIESLEEEVDSLRRDLEQASVALKAAQEEVTAREEALEEKERARSAAEVQARDALGEITGLRIRSSEEQLSLTNQHIAELARLQNGFQDQLGAEIESALSTEDREELREEHLRVRRRVEEQYEERAAALENSYREAQERLLEGEREFDRQRTAEISEIRKEAEDERQELEGKLREELEQRLQEALRESNDHGLGSQAGVQELPEDQRTELENRIREDEERYQAKLREIKGLAENREQELKKAHAARMAEAKAEAERRIETLRSQRAADNKVLRTRHEEDLAELRAEYERRLEDMSERSRLELWTTQEKLEGLKMEKTSEATAYTTRLEELEAALQSEGRSEELDREEPGTPGTGGGLAEQASPENVALLGKEIEDLKTALVVSEHARDALARELDEAREQRENVLDTAHDGHENREEPERQTEEPRHGAANTDMRVRELEARLQESREEGRRNAEELQRAIEDLRRLSDPEHRLRAGISTFNESEHARHVASISKSLGQPKVYAETDKEADKPVFTFVWEEFAWRRYVAEPAEDVQEPRVYLLGGGEEPEEVGEEGRREPNARVDAQGRLILGVQAR